MIMKNVMRVVLYILINAGGYLVTPVLMNVAALINILPALENDAAIRSFQLWLAGGGMWAWIIAALASIGYFFAGGKLKHGLLLAPLYVPALYGVCVILAFKYF